MGSKEAKENGSKANISLIAVDFPSYFYIIIASVLYTGTICCNHPPHSPHKGAIFLMEIFKKWQQVEHLLLI